MRAVKWKRRKLEARTAKRFQKVLTAKPIPTVRGPGGELFMVDHHHFGLALWQSGVESAYVRLIDDASDLDAVAFWRHMETTGRLYLFDEDGHRVPPTCLPTWLHALRHDPYRDIAWTVREAGGFAKAPEPYAEFRWANFFRERIDISTVRRNYDTAVDKAMRLSRSKAASHLPGFRGKRT